MDPSYYEQGPQDNYSGKTKKPKNLYQNNDYNINYQIGNEYQTPSTNAKITLYNNGYTINNGPLNNITIPQYKKNFMQLERGVIPQEIVNKGITNANIFDKRRNVEIISYTPASTGYTPQNITFNTTNINQNIYTNNAYNDNYYQVDNYQAGTNKNINKDNTYYNYPQDIYGGQDYNNIYNNNNYAYQDNLNINNLNYDMNNLNIGDYSIPKQKTELIPTDVQKNKAKVITQTNNVIQPPPQNKVVNTNNVVPKKEPEIVNKDVNQNKKTEAKTNIKPKKPKKNIRTLGSFLREEKEKEEEENMRKLQKMKNQPVVPIKEEPKEKEDEKKFVPFGGEGFNIGNVNVEGLFVRKGVTHSFNESIPRCHLNIRLFNGEIVTTDFNATQTLASIYKYVKKLSGSDNFILLEGFPPRPLKQLNKTIKELKLDNTTLTQKLAENMKI